MLRTLGKPMWSAFTLWHAARRRSLPTWPGDRLRALQDSRVRAIVAHAWATVPFYRRAMEERGLRPNNLTTAADLARLPLLSGEQLSSDPWAFFSSRYRPSTTLELPTSGSTGHFKRIFHNPVAVFVASAHCRRFAPVFRAFLDATNGYRELSVARSDGTSAAIAEFFHHRALTRPRFSQYRRIVPISAPFEDVITEMRAWRPDILNVFGSYAGALFRYIEERGLDLPLPKVVLFGGDAMTPQERARIERDHGVVVLSTYQACECLFIGFECEHRQGFHINVDDVAVRIAGPSGQSLPPGKRGTVVISNLLNRATVLLNYRLGDAARLDVSPCPCGRTLPRLVSLDGRSDDLVQLPDGRSVHESIILSSLYSVPGVARVQVVQEQPRSFLLRVIDNRGALHEQVHREAEHALRRALAFAGELSIRTECVRTITAEPSGKIKSVVSLLRPTTSDRAGLRYTSRGHAGEVPDATAQGINRESDDG